MREMITRQSAHMTRLLDGLLEMPGSTSCGTPSADGCGQRGAASRTAATFWVTKPPMVTTHNSAPEIGNLVAAANRILGSRGNPHTNVGGGQSLTVAALATRPSSHIALPSGSDVSLSDLDGIDPIGVKGKVFPNLRYGGVRRFVGPDGID